MVSAHIHIGQIGEQTVVNHLKRKGYTIRGRNYRKKWGEIDVIVEKEGKIHFVEVKTVSHETKGVRGPRETWLPEENVDRRKLHKLFLTIEIWLAERAYTGDWQLDVASVWLQKEGRGGRIKILENITPEF